MDIPTIKISEILSNIKVPPYSRHTKKLTPSAWSSSQKSSAFIAVQVICLLRENFIPVYYVGTIAQLQPKSKLGFSVNVSASSPSYPSAIYRSDSVAGSYFCKYLLNQPNRYVPVLFVHRQQIVCHTDYTSGSNLDLQRL